MKATAVTSLLFVLLCTTLPAQEIDLTLEVNTTALNPSVQDMLDEFQGVIERYITEHRWTDIDFYSDQIKVNMSINFISGNDAGDFTAQVVIASQRIIYNNGRATPEGSMIFRIMDPSWNFTYKKGTPIVHDEYQFNEIASLMDFYMYIVIGLDFDSMELLQGTPYYQKALTAAQRSQNSQRQSEWRGASNQYSRMNLVSEFLNANYQDYRRAMYWYYYEGLDFMQTEKEPAKKSIARALQMFSGVMSAIQGQSILTTMWLELQATNFCTYLDGFPSRKQIMDMYAQIDPQRADIYRACGM